MPEGHKEGHAGMQHKIALYIHYDSNQVMDNAISHAHDIQYKLPWLSCMPLEPLYALVLRMQRLTCVKKSTAGLCSSSAFASSSLEYVLPGSFSRLTTLAAAAGVSVSPEGKHVLMLTSSFSPKVLP